MRCRLMSNECVIYISGNFAVEEAARFRANINKMIEDGQYSYILDFSQCNFVDSTGLGVIVASYKKCKEHNGNIKLRTLKADIKKVFELTRLDKVLDILD
jgi:anti-sigma B factor antagonist